MSQQSTHAKTAPGWLLLIGAVVGLLLAGLSIVETGEPGAPADSMAATVNGVGISNAEFEDALASVASDSRHPIDRGDRDRVLSRLIDEELLLQQALSLGLERQDRVVRNLLVRSMLDLIVSTSGAVDEPPATAVEAFYQANSTFFRRSCRVRVRQLRFTAATADAARDLATQSRVQLLAGAPFETVRETADAVIVDIPDTLLPMSALRQYVGPELAELTSSLEVGEISQPIAADGGYRFILVVERTEPVLLPLSEIEDTVRAEMALRDSEAAYEAYMQALRSSAELQRSER